MLMQAKWSLVSGVYECGSKPTSFIKSRDVLHHLESYKHIKDCAILDDFFNTPLALMFVRCDTIKRLCACRFACLVLNFYDMLMLKNS
jgi:hypothetical protein